jgi:hypothetical protein
VAGAVVLDTVQFLRTIYDGAEFARNVADTAAFTHILLDSIGLWGHIVRDRAEFISKIVDRLEFP